MLLHREAIPPKMLSVIVPCFNEEEVIRDTYERLIRVLGALLSLSLEIIFVDDGSRDQTLSILQEIQSKDNRIRVLSFSRNFGHQIAVTAGLEHASGDCVALIDADLQDPPEVILEMIDMWQKGVDVAYGVRTEREGETPFKRLSARMFYRAINRISDIPIPLDTGDFRLMDRRVVKSLLSMPERDRFLRGMVAWVGFRQQPVAYKRVARLAGSTKYPLSKMLRFAADGLLSFSLLPLRFASWMGFIAAGLSLLGIVYALTLRLLTSIWVPGWTLLFIAFLFFGGIQLVSLGLIGEYLGRVYGEVKNRPLYIIKERFGFIGTTDSSLAHAPIKRTIS